MDTQDLPRIAEADIRRLADGQSFGRGKSYYESGAILEPFLQGNVLRAYCEGSQYEPYRVTATLDEDGVASTECTCPYDWGGICKHLVALLLTWVHEPERFQVTPPLEEVLGKHSKKELIELIGEMLERAPDLARLLERPTPSGGGIPVDLEPFRRRITQALNRIDFVGVADELVEIQKAADRFLKAGEEANAGILYHLALSKVIPEYEELYEEEGDIAIALDECAQGLDRCLKEGNPDAEIRRAWLEALLEAELEDVRMGGIDLAPSAGEAVLRHATDEEWVWIEEKVRQAMQGQRDWSREALLRFLAKRLESTGRKGEVEALILREGTPEQRAFLLLKRGQVEEAVAIARQHFATLPGLALQFADALVGADAGPEAVAFMMGQAHQTHPHPKCIEWLASYHRKHGDPKSALEFWTRRFRQAPSLEAYRSLKEMAAELSIWDQQRRELLRYVQKRGQVGLQIEIALEEGEISHALELLPKLTGWEATTYQAKVAQAAEADYPRAAIGLYQQLAEGEIAGRQRRYYQEAAHTLRRVQALFRQVNAGEEWEVFIRDLRDRYRSLRALQDELNRARL